MNFLLDTNVVSETRKRSPNANVIQWLARTAPDSLYLSVLTIGELTKGIARVRESEPDTAAALNHWLLGIEAIYSERLICIDASIAVQWGELNAARSLPAIDTLLAATAQVHDLTFVTRNVADVASTGVPTVNPWEIA